MEEGTGNRLEGYTRRGEIESIKNKLLVKPACLRKGTYQ
jgi:hypothetical protein